MHIILYVHTMYSHRGEIIFCFCCDIRYVYSKCIYLRNSMYIRNSCIYSLILFLNLLSTHPVRAPNNNIYVYCTSYIYHIMLYIHRNENNIYIYIHLLLGGIPFFFGEGVHLASSCRSKGERLSFIGKSVPKSLRNFNFPSPII